MKRILAVALFLACPWIGSAQNAPVRVFASNGVKAALEALKAGVEQAAGHPLNIVYGASGGLKGQIAAGEAFDLAILTPEATGDLTHAGKIAAGTAADLARTGVGFGIRTGAARPDVSTPDAVKQTLLKANSIAIVKEGASRVVIDKMFERLGIAQAMAAKTIPENGTADCGESVAQGRSEMEIVPLSEVPLIAGVQILGPLPGDLQSYLYFQASIGADAKEPAAAKKAIQYLTSAAAVPVFKAKGMEAGR
ncbi:MAG: substrate-binding domain-containing protein [Acidobacteriota bacterium]|nr:substrate-binding domain-containing protein [Acidobacteriota bacterium]